MVTSIRLEHNEKFAEFNLKSQNDRLDTLYYDIIGENGEFNEFSLLHGQAAVERGFSINKDIIESNMSERTMIAQRMICDGLRLELPKEATGDVSKIILNKEMLTSCHRARSRYEAYLTEIKDSLKTSGLEAEKLKLKEELQAERKSVVNLEKSYVRHSKITDELALKAEKEKKFSLIVESNASRKRALEIKDSIENAKSKIMKLEDQLKKFLFGCRLIKVFVEVRVEAEFRYHCLSL